MDEMRFESKLTRTIVSKLVKKGIKKKFGYDVDVDLNNFRTTVIDGKTHVHLDVDLELNEKDFATILESIGL